MSHDPELEALIDRAGRDRVFARARACGWGSSDAPPKWVWRAIAMEILAEHWGPQEREPLPRMIVHHHHEEQPASLLGVPFPRWLIG